jgi:ADP-heptose:LPS heptosyltransferase
MGSKSMARVAAWRGGALGDLVLTLPALDLLRRRHGDAALDLVAPPAWAPLAAPDRAIDHGSPALAPLYLPGCPDLPDCAASLRRATRVLVYAVDPDGVLAGNLRRLLPGGVWVHDPRPPDGFAGHITEHLLAPLEPATADLGWPRIDLTPAETAAAGAWRRDAGLAGPLAAVHAGSSTPAKNWPAAGYAAVAARLAQHGFTPVFVVGPVERDQGWAAPWPGAARFPTGTSRQLAALLAQASLFVGNDSGPGHLAAAVGVPTLSLFGPTAAARWRPRGPHTRVLEAPGGCWENLGEALVTETALALLQDIGTRPKPD